MANGIEMAENNQLSKFTILELIREIVKREGYAHAPIKTVRHGTHYEVLFAIGDDEAGHIIFTDDALPIVTGELRLGQCGKTDELRRKERAAWKKAGLDE